MKSISENDEHPKTFRTNYTDKSKGAQGIWIEKCKKAQWKSQRSIEDVGYGSLPIKEANLDRNAIGL